MDLADAPPSTQCSQSGTKRARKIDVAGDPLTVALGRAIRQRRNDVVECWLEQVKRDIARHPGTSLTQLRDGLPDYLDALSSLLCSGEDIQTLSRDPKVASAWTDVAREHGITRVRIGFDIEQLIHEFVVLRHVLCSVVEEEGVTSRGAETAIADLLEAGIEVAVKAYVEARDFESRRRQAEHIGFLTHELRSPLSAAMLATPQIRSHAPPELTHRLDILDRNHEKLRTLIDSVLLTEKLEAGKVIAHPSPTKLGDLLESAVEAARMSASNKGLDFRTKYDPERVVEVDPNLTRSAIQNIADNAVRYTDRGLVEVTVDDLQSELVIHVRDTGQGLSPEELKTIFEPFERGRTHKAGTGLGLAIARRAIEAQGGQIGAESSEASGCHFWLRLPASVQQEPRSSN